MKNNTIATYEFNSIISDIINNDAVKEMKNITSTTTVIVIHIV